MAEAAGVGHLGGRPGCGPVRVAGGGTAPPPGR